MDDTKATTDVLSNAPAGAPAAGDSSVADSSLNLSAIRADVLRKSTKTQHNWPLVLVALGAVASVFAWIGFRNSGAAPEPGLQSGTALVARPDAVRPVAQSQPAPPEPPAGVSWTAAERYFAAGDYDRALTQYQQLLSVSAQRPGPGPMAGLFRIRIADCVLRKGDAADYRRILTEACQGPSPLVNCLANYRLAMLDFDQEIWMQARMRAYCAIACSAALENADEIVAQCDLLAARSLTQQVLKVTAVDATLPHLPLKAVDAITGSSEESLVGAILNGSNKVTASALGPRITRLSDADILVRWQGVCLAAPVEQTLNRLGHAVGCDVLWSGVAAPVRARGITALTGAMTQQRLFEVFAGAAGLIAQFDGKQSTVSDPTASDSAAAQRQLLLSESAAAWRRLLLRESDHLRQAEGHYALGIINECLNDRPAAVTEYRLTARQYSQSLAAPQALLRSAKVCLAMKDYAGAEEDLTALLDTYPQSAGMDDVFLALGKANLESGREAEALRFFKRVYYLDRSVETKMAAALGAGNTGFRRGDYQQAVSWLGKYVSLSGGMSHIQTAPVHLMIARSHMALGNLSQARRALWLCLSAKPQAQVELEALFEMAVVEERSDRYAAAVILCNRAESRIGADDRLRGQVVLLRAQLHRRMGLTDNAAVDLRRRLQHVTDPAEAATLTLELAACYRLGGQSSEAYSLLLDLLTRVKPGPAAHQAQCELAELSLELGKNAQAATLATELLRMNPDTLLQGRARQVLVAAQVSQKDFNTAVSTMTVGPKVTGGDRR
ncbi:MAG: tetratricopeptide repeat protein [Planctomycetaceae bacterium]|nr:tetratricopeptide repeat protein [Planctomycetaceae bacterium]